MRWLVAVGIVTIARAALATPLLDRIEVLGDGAAVKLHLTGPVKAKPGSLAARDGAPDRVYVDLPGTLLAPASPRVVTGSGSLLRVRSGQFDMETVRVVLDLARATPYSLVETADGITVELRAAPPVAAEPPPVVAAAPPAPQTAPTPPPAAAPPPATPPEEPPPSLPSRRPVAPTTAKRDSAPGARAALGHPLVVVDAGHGGRDPGAEGVGGIREKDVVLDLARRFATRLAIRLPVDVILTRSDDTFVPIERRLALPSERATLFVSLHANACTDPTARGLEVFYGGGPLRNASSMGADPRAVLLGRALGRSLDERIGGVRGPARPGPFGVLVRNPVPSALVEVGYLTHPDEAARFRDPDYEAELADALVDGVATFLRASAPPL
jgi:N-acetylmuramoyl-L-alanine amidase